MSYLMLNARLVVHVLKQKTSLCFDALQSFDVSSRKKQQVLTYFSCGRLLKNQSVRNKF